jgi:hypothetical protein
MGLKPNGILISILVLCGVIFTFFIIAFTLLPGIRSLIKGAH